MTSEFKIERNELGVDTVWVMVTQSMGIGIRINKTGQAELSWYGTSYSSMNDSERFHRAFAVAIKEAEKLEDEHSKTGK